MRPYRVQQPKHTLEVYQIPITDTSVYSTYAQSSFQLYSQISGDIHIMFILLLLSQFLHFYTSSITLAILQLKKPLKVKIPYSGKFS